MGLRSGLPGVPEFLDRVLADQAFGIRGRRRGWFGAIMAIAWLGYLISPILRSWSRGERVVAIAGAAALLVFGAIIVGSFIILARPGGGSVQDHPPDRRVWVVLAVMTGVGVLLVVLLGSSAVPTAIYVAVIGIIYLPLRESGFVVVAVTAALLILPVAIPAAHLGSIGLYVGVIPVLVWMGRKVGVRGERLTELNRRQSAELAIVEERNRVARDVHDILGHSLTVITVKTELAQRLIDVDLSRAKSEMADVERLAREALSGVRDTVGGLREVTLRGELDTARTALDAADIDAELPDIERLPDTPHSEMFGWVLREAITNVIRHSAARNCTVTVTETGIEVVDDGRGLAADAGPSGSGLSGLRERLRADGGTLTLSTPREGGLCIRATVPE